MLFFCLQFFAFCVFGPPISCHVLVTKKRPLSRPMNTSASCTVEGRGIEWRGLSTVQATSCRSQNGTRSKRVGESSESRVRQILQRGTEFLVDGELLLAGGECRRLQRFSTLESKKNLKSII